MPRTETNPPKTGDIFGQLTIIERSSEDRAYFLCQCACGAQKKIRRDHLKTGKTVSCGCVRTAGSAARAHIMHKANTTHGLKGTRIEGVWHAMKQRCFNPKHSAFKYYGGRGIIVCDRWKDSLSNFLEDMGHPPDSATIERTNNNGPYSYENCCWATRTEQSVNRRSNRRLEYQGLNLTISQWSKRQGIHRNTLDHRLKKGWPIPEALETPVLRRKINHN